jgi:hypothetical protein
MDFFIHFTIYLNYDYHRRKVWIESDNLFSSLLGSTHKAFEKSRLPYFT